MIWDLLAVFGIPLIFVVALLLSRLEARLSKEKP